MRPVRQRFALQGEVHATDSPKSNGSYEPMDGPKNEIPTGPVNGQTLTDMIEFLKTEHGLCLERNECRTDLFGRGENEFTKSWSTDARKKTEVFGEMKERATKQNRWESADGYQTIEGTYRAG